jgi:hypothetical protein
MSVIKSLVVVMGAAISMLGAVDAAALCKQAGATTKVLWKGDWYDASVVKAEPARCLVTYKGYGKEDDEWVGPDRLRVEVQWKGDWYKARVIKVNPDSYRVTYEGYGKEDDENVKLDRIRIR